MTALILRYGAKFGPWLLIAGAAFGWYESALHRAAENALAKHQADSLQVAIAAVGKERDAARASRDSANAAAAAAIQRSQARVAGLEHTNAGLVQQLNTALSVDTLTPDSIKMLVNSAVDSLAAQIQTQQAIIEQQALLLHNDSLTIAGLDSTVTELRGLNQSTLKALKIAQAKASPGFLATAWRALPAIAAVGVAGYVLGSR